MSLRWREDGDLVCAATTEEAEGDTYIDDRLHYQLAVLTRAIHPDPQEKTNSLWYWREES